MTTANLATVFLNDSPAPYCVFQDGSYVIPATPGRETITRTYRGKECHNSRLELDYITDSTIATKFKNNKPFIQEVIDTASNEVVWRTFFYKNDKIVIPMSHPKNEKINLDYHFDKGLFKSLNAYDAESEKLLSFMCCIENKNYNDENYFDLLTLNVKATSEENDPKLAFGNTHDLLGFFTKSSDYLLSSHSINAHGLMLQNSDQPEKQKLLFFDNGNLISEIAWPVQEENGQLVSYSDRENKAAYPVLEPLV